MHYNTSAPTCVLEQEEKLAAVESARAALRAERASRLESFLAGRPYGSGEKEEQATEKEGTEADAEAAEAAADASAQAAASAAFCLPRAAAASTAASLFRRAHEAADTVVRLSAGSLRR